MSRKTPGEWMRESHPEWEHDCCCSGACNYRSRHIESGKMKCSSPDICDYRVPNNQEGKPDESDTQ